MVRRGSTTQRGGRHERRRGKLGEKREKLSEREEELHEGEKGIRGGFGAAVVVGDGRRRLSVEGGGVAVVERKQRGKRECEKQRV